MDVQAQAHEKRKAAEQARRMALALSAEADKARIFAFAEELEAQADALEGQQAAGPPSRGVEQPQQQVQQQGRSTKPETPKD
jgi:hypothetical protein